MTRIAYHPPKSASHGHGPKVRGLRRAWAATQTFLSQHTHARLNTPLSLSVWGSTRWTDPAVAESLRNQAAMRWGPATRVSGEFHDWDLPGTSTEEALELVIGESLMSVHDLSAQPLHLGRGGSASVEPPFSGSMDWYSDYEARHAGEGVEGRLVSMHSFTGAWAMWEMHPHGSEVVLCTSGRMTLLQERADGGVSSIELAPGQYAVNPPGIWHTADIVDEATAVFITAGSGTQHRPR